MFGLPNDYTHSKQGDGNRADVKTIKHQRWVNI